MKHQKNDSNFVEKTSRNFDDVEEICSPVRVAVVMEFGVEVNKKYVNPDNIFCPDILDQSFLVIPFHKINVSHCIYNKN